jgi:hypothetical protein
MAMHTRATGFPSSPGSGPLQFGPQSFALRLVHCRSSGMVFRRAAGPSFDSAERKRSQCRMLDSQRM